MASYSEHTPDFLEWQGELSPEIIDQALEKTLIIRADLFKTALEGYNLAAELAQIAHEAQTLIHNIIEHRSLEESDDTKNSKEKAEEQSKIIINGRTVTFEMLKLRAATDLQLFSLLPDLAKQTEFTANDVLRRGFAKERKKDVRNQALLESRRRVFGALERQVQQSVVESMGYGRARRYRFLANISRPGEEAKPNLRLVVDSPLENDQDPDKPDTQVEKKQAPPKQKPQPIDDEPRISRVHLRDSYARRQAEKEALSQAESLRRSLEPQVKSLLAARKAQKNKNARRDIPLVSSTDNISKATALYWGISQDQRGESVAGDIEAISRELGLTEYGVTTLLRDALKEIISSADDSVKQKAKTYLELLSA